MIRSGGSGFGHWKNLNPLAKSDLMFGLQKQVTIADGGTIYENQLFGRTNGGQK